MIEIPIDSKGKKAESILRRAERYKRSETQSFTAQEWPEKVTLLLHHLTHAQERVFQAAKCKQITKFESVHNKQRNLLALDDNTNSVEKERRVLYIERVLASAETKVL